MSENCQSIWWFICVCFVKLDPHVQGIHINSSRQFHPRCSTTFTLRRYEIWSLSIRLLSCLSCNFPRHQTRVCWRPSILTVDANRDTCHNRHLLLLQHRHLFWLLFRHGLQQRTCWIILLFSFRIQQWSSFHDHPLRDTAVPKQITKKRWMCPCVLVWGSELEKPIKLEH